MNEVSKKIANMSNKEKEDLFKQPAGIISLQENCKVKTINISEDLHQELKFASAREKKSMVELVDTFIKKGLASLIILFLFIGCGTVRYVEVDPVNMKRFQHDQKVEAGMDQKQIIEMLGSPDDIKHKYMVGKSVVAFEYYKKIFCKGYSCFVYFNRDNKVMFTHGIRMEFDKTLINLD